MTKNLRFKIISLVFALFVAAYATGTVFAWFTNQYWNLELIGNTIGAYFAYGDGSEYKLDNKGNIIYGTTDEALKDWDMATGPFGISNSTHMFNLAWLQNTGKFKSKPYHFELANEIDMRDVGKTVVLPPIGNSQYPFKDVFNGNGFTIKNLVISTNKDVLYGTPADENYVFSNAVGLFGMTYCEEGKEAAIENFILYYPTVEVSNVNTLYADTSKQNEDLVVGIAVGYVADDVTVHSIGVVGGTLAVRKADYDTYNSILGNLSDNAKNSNNLPGTGVGGSGNQFGGDFDADGIWARFELIAGNLDDNDEPISFKLPNITKNDDGSYSLQKGEKMPFTVSNINTENYRGPDAKEIVSPNNIGYILGDKNEIVNGSVSFATTLPYSKQLVIGDKQDYYFADANGSATTAQPSNGTVPRWFYKFVNEKENQTPDYYSGRIYPMSEADMKEDGMQDIILQVLGLEVNEKGEFVEAYNSDGTPALQPNANNKYPLDSLWVNGRTDSYYGSINLSTDAGNSDNINVWTLHGMIEWGSDEDGNPTTYGEGYEKNGSAANEYGDYYDGTVSGSATILSGYFFTDTDSRLFKYNEDGTKTYVNGTGTKVPIYKFTKGIFLPNVGVWFRPSNNGKIRLILYSDMTGAGISLLKIKRPAKAVADTGNKFAVDLGGNDYINWGTGGITIESKSLILFPANVFFYFEFDVEQNGDTEYEYWITEANNSYPNTGGAKFVFMDIGSSASIDSGDDTGVAIPTKQVTAIDFIYTGVIILPNDITDDAGAVLIHKGSFVTEDKKRYVETGTRLYFESDTNGNSAIVTYYYRQEPNPNDDSNAVTITAKYNAENNRLVSSNESKATITPTSDNVVVDGKLQNFGWTL